MRFFFLYILKCADNSYYVGHTDDLEKRFSEHTTGSIPGYTSTRLPVLLVFQQQFATREEAIEAEQKIKNGIEIKRKH